MRWRVRFEGSFRQSRFGVLRVLLAGLLTTLLGIMPSAGWAVAEGPGVGKASGQRNTLSRLARSGRIVLGVRDTAWPVSYLDATGAQMGFQLDVCLLVVQALRKRYDLPNLKVVTVPTTPATRFAVLNNGTVDIECGHNPINSSAMQQALVSHATLLMDVQVMVREDLKDIQLVELAGRSVALVVGGTALPSLRMLTRTAPLRVKEVAVRAVSEGFGMLEQGRVDAIASSGVYLGVARMLSANPTNYYILPPVLRTDPVGLMFNLEDEELQALANGVIADLMSSGAMTQLHEKWFMKQAPGLPRALEVPASPALLRLYAKPGSEVLGF